MIESIKDLLELTVQAKALAEERNFQGLGDVIAKRQDVIKKIDSESDEEFSDEQVEMIKEMVVRVGQLDKEIISLLKNEMKELTQEILEVTTQLRVVSAYANGFSLGRRFDTIL